MARTVRKIRKWITWALALILLLLFLLTLVFYLFRGSIKEKGVAYFNGMQNGMLEVGRISFIPLMNFPDVTLKIRDVQYTGAPDSSGTGNTILMLERIALSLDMKALLHGEYHFSRINLDGGIVQLKIFEDGSSNLEKALGNLLASDTVEADSSSSVIKLNLERLALRNIVLSFDNEELDTYVALRIEQLNAGLSYYPEEIRSAVDLDLVLTTLSSSYYNFANPRGLHFHGAMAYDQDSRMLTVDPSALNLKQTEMEVWGSYDLGEGGSADLTFRAKNSGLELLNFLLNGVLDLDELEQTGSGAIYLSGTLKGSFAKELPDIKVNFGADGLGFRIKSIDREVSDISFTGYVNNGTKPDYSESVAIINNLHARLPEGELNGNFSVSNLVNPLVDVKLEASASLEGLDAMLADSMISELKGGLSLSADLQGRINPSKGEFLSDSSRLSINFSGLSFRPKGKELSKLEGDVEMKGRLLSIENLVFESGGSSIRFDGNLSGAISALLGLNESISGAFHLNSPFLSLSELTGDSSYLEEPYGEIRGLDLDCSFNTGRNFYKQITENALPDNLRLFIRNFSGEIRGSAPLYGFSGEIRMNNKDISLVGLSGNVGESPLQLNADVSHYPALYNGDSLSGVDMNLNIKSARLYAKDIMTYGGEFMLPESYKEDYFDQFSINAGLSFPPGAFSADTFQSDLTFRMKNLQFIWSSYPFKVSALNLLGSTSGDRLSITEMSGNIGNSQIRLSGYLDNIYDSLSTAMSGALDLQSKVIDLDEILEIYYASDEEESPVIAAEADTTDDGESFFESLSHYSYPTIDLALDVEKILYETAEMKKLTGKVHLNDSKVFILDSLAMVSSSGGALLFDGKFSVLDPSMYILGARVDLSGFNIKDLNIEMEYDDKHYSLQDNFAGILSLSGLAELYVTPDMSLDMGGSTGFLSLSVRDGGIRNFAPLHELARYFGNKDLDDVRFAELKCKITLMDGRVYIPTTSIGSTIGPIIIEGEHGFDNTYNYRLRLPPNLVKGAAWSAVTYREGKDKDGEDEILNASSGRFYIVNIKGNGDDIDIKVGDKGEDKKDKGK